MTDCTDPVVSAEPTVEQALEDYVRTAQAYKDCKDGKAALVKFLRGMAGK